MKNMRLQNEQREFLELISKAAFANPFGEERRNVNEVISGIAKGGRGSGKLEEVIAEVQAFWSRLESSGKVNINSYDESDRGLLLSAHLFDVFHIFIQNFDELILKQIEEAESSCTVPFGSEALKMLTARGLNKQEALRYFAMFYQLRRAFYFIDCTIVGSCPSIMQLKMSLWKNVFTSNARLYESSLWNRMEDFSTLLLGETGTGKGTAASAIGRSGFVPFNEKQQCFTESFTRSFIEINLSQFSETLIESELFGHRKGAFTGAAEAHPGVFAQCSPYGAIFLDEIGDVSIPVQIKLLKVLQERLFTPVGSHEKKRFHGRVIAASNRSIEDLRRDNLFRDDFYYRLCSDIIYVPTLRQCIQEDAADLDLLLSFIITRILGEERGDVFDLVRSVIERDLGMDYEWPGNVRELEQCVRRILITQKYKGDKQAPSFDLQDRFQQAANEGTYTAQGLLSDYCTMLYQRFGTYEEVSRRTQLDRRTVKKYISDAISKEP